MKTRTDYLEYYILGCAGTARDKDVEGKWLMSLVNGLRQGEISFQMAYDQMMGYYVGQFSADGISIEDLDGCIENLTDIYNDPNPS